MTPCATIRPLVQESLDRVLDDASRRALDAHLTGCAECRAYRDALGGLDSRLAAMPAAKAPAALLAGLDFDSAPARAPRRPAPPRWALSTAAGVLVLVGLWRVLPTTLQGPTAPQTAAAVAVEANTDPLLGMFEQEASAGSAILDAIDLPAEE